MIERGTTPGQRVVTGTLADIDARVRAAGLHPPALIVVGEVVRLREQLAWHDSQPLAGRRILVPRVRRRPSEIVRLLKAAGAETAEVPVLRSDTLPAASGLLRPPRRRRLARVHLAGRHRRAARAARRSWAETCAPWAAHAWRPWARPLPPICAAAACAWTTRPRPPPASLRGLPGVSGARLAAHRRGRRRPACRPRPRRGRRHGVELPVFRLAVDERAPLPAIGEFDAVAFASSNTARRFLEAYPDGPADGPAAW